jgi:hypothetical protein
VPDRPAAVDALVDDARWWLGELTAGVPGL